MECKHKLNSVSVNFSKNEENKGTNKKFFFGVSREWRHKYTVRV